MPAIPGNQLFCFQRKLYYAHIMLHYVVGSLTLGLGQATCCKLADYAWLHAAVNPSTSENLSPYMYRAVFGQL